MSRTCESCGWVAHVVLADGSAWCWGCHEGAHSLGYDQEHPVALLADPAAEWVRPTETVEVMGEAP